MLKVDQTIVMSFSLSLRATIGRLRINLEADTSSAELPPEAEDEFEFVEAEEEPTAEEPVEETEAATPVADPLYNPLGFREERPDSSVSSSCRFYCVWSVPNLPLLSGIHWGEGALPYRKLLDINNGSIGGLKFKRCGSFEEARDLFIEKAEAKRVDRRDAQRGFHWL